MEMTTNRRIAPENWLSENESAFPLNKSNKELNKYLEIHKGKIFSAYSSLLSTLRYMIALHSIFSTRLFSGPMGMICRTRLHPFRAAYNSGTTTAAWWVRIPAAGAVLSGNLQ